MQVIETKPIVSNVLERWMEKYIDIVGWNNSASPYAPADAQPLVVGLLTSV